MATERGFYEINPEASRRASNPEGPVLFRGGGDATFTVFGFETWKEFLSRGDRPLTEAELERIEEAADFENFSVGGRVAVEWPEVELAFSMDNFIGGYIFTILRFLQPRLPLCVCGRVRDVLQAGKSGRRRLS